MAVLGAQASSLQAVGRPPWQARCLNVTYLSPLTGLPVGQAFLPAIGFNLLPGLADKNVCPTCLSKWHWALMPPGMVGINAGLFKLAESAAQETG